MNQELSCARKSYEPSLKELARNTSKEIYKDTKSFLGSTWNGIKIASTFSWQTGKTALKSFIVTNAAPYRIKTVVRKCSDAFDDSDISAPQLIGALSGFAAGIYTIANNQYEFYSKNPKYLLIPVAANVASSLYEKVRTVRQKLTDEKRRSLESRLS